jgi:membrane-associated phospholipid phosphatase
MYLIFCPAPFRKYGKYIVTVSLIVFAAGCATPRRQNSWGNDPIWPLDKERLSKAAYNALIDPQTYIPAAGALIFTIDHWDRRASDRLSQDNPIFGSQTNAEDYSNFMLWALVGETVITGLSVPGDTNFYHRDTGQGKLLLAEGAGIGGAALTSVLLQNITNRTRPSGSSNSFPSGHASISFAATTMSNRNLDSIDMSDSTRAALQAGNILLASSVGWARVESRKHYPSDVLAGAALGHFISSFIYDSFMDQDDNQFGFMVLPYERGAAFSIGGQF